MHVPQKGAWAIKELLEGLLLVALLKFLDVPLRLIAVGLVLFVIGNGLYIYAEVTAPKQRARALVIAEARAKQQAEETKEAERVRQEALADAEWRARFV